MANQKKGGGGTDAVGKVLEWLKGQASAGKTPELTLLAGSETDRSQWFNNGAISLKQPFTDFQWIVIMQTSDSTTFVTPYMWPVPVFQKALKLAKLGATHSVLIELWNSAWFFDADNTTSSSLAYRKDDTGMIAAVYGVNYT